MNLLQLIKKINDKDDLSLDHLLKIFNKNQSLRKTRRDFFCLPVIGNDIFILVF